MENKLRIDKMEKDDWKHVQAIYVEGIQTENATFDTEPPTWEEWDRSHLKDCRFVARIQNQVVGWASLSKTAHKDAYHGVAEVSIYVSSSSSGKGIGFRLLEELVQASEEIGFWTLQALIFPENTASLKLHKRLGFEVIGTRIRVGKLNGVWRDVVFLERRSTVVGTD